jgi:hypothetical protein
MTPIDRLNAELSNRDELAKNTPMRFLKIKASDCVSCLLGYDKCKWIVDSKYSARQDEIRAFLAVAGYLHDKNNKVTLTAKGMALIGRATAS